MARIRTYRTWVVFTLALSVLLGLTLVPVERALRRSQQIYAEIRATQDQYGNGRRAFETLEQNVFAISLTIREFLLDNSPEANRTYLSRVQFNWDEVQRSLADLHRILPQGEASMLGKLETELNGYWDSILPVFQWTPPQRTERSAYFLRAERRPRSQSILAMTADLASIHLSFYREQERRINQSERAFSDDLGHTSMLVLLVGILVSVAGVFRIRWLEGRAHEQHLQSQQTSEEMRNLSTRLRHAQEEERRKLSRELHDDVGQKLTALRMELGALDRLRAGPAREFDNVLAQIKDLAEDSLRTTRDISAGLRPSALDDLGLEAALQKQVREFSKRTGTPASLEVNGDFSSLTELRSSNVYRIVQEALTNCAKHSRANKVSVRITGTDDRIHVSVADDGIGFDSTRAVHTGLGLMGIEERARELGGSLTIESMPSRGTTLQVTIPRNGAVDERD